MRPGYIFIHAEPALFKWDCGNKQGVWTGDRTSTVSIMPARWKSQHVSCRIPEAEIQDQLNQEAWNLVEALQLSLTKWSGSWWLMFLTPKHYHQNSAKGLIKSGLLLKIILTINDNLSDNLSKCSMIPIKCVLFPLHTALTVCCGFPLHFVWACWCSVLLRCWHWLALKRCPQMSSPRKWRRSSERGQSSLTRLGRPIHLADMTPNIWVFYEHRHGSISQSSELIQGYLYHFAFQKDKQLLTRQSQAEMTNPHPSEWCYVTIFSVVGVIRKHWTA